MSDVPKEAATPSPSPKPETPSGKAAVRNGRWPKWRRRLKWLAIIAIVLGVLFRVLLSILLPVVVDKAAGFYGLDCTYDRISLGVLTGEASIWGLKLTPVGGGDPIAQLDYVRGDISVLRLLTGRLVVWRAEADGVDLRMERTAQGDSPLLKLLLAPRAAKVQSAPAVSATSTEPEKFDLDAPLTVEAFRLSHVRARIIDQMIQPHVDATLAMDLRVSDIGRPGLPVRFEMDFWADPVLDLMRVSGTADLKGNSMSAKMDITARGIRLRPVEGYLAAFDITPAANEITAHMSGALTAQATTPDASSLDVTLTLSNLALLADGQEAAAIDSLVLSINPFSYTKATFGGASIDGVRMHAIRTVDGRLRVGGIELGASADASRFLMPTPLADLYTRDLLSITSGSNSAASPWASAAVIRQPMDRRLVGSAASGRATANTSAYRPTQANLPTDLSLLLPALFSQIQTGPSTIQSGPSTVPSAASSVSTTNTASVAPARTVATTQSTPQITTPPSATVPTPSVAAPESQPAPAQADAPATSPASTLPATQPATLPASEPATQPTTGPVSSVTHLPPGSISITRVALQFDDYAVSPAVSLQLMMPKLELLAGPNTQGHFTANNYTLDGVLNFPGILAELHISGVVEPDASGLHAAIDLRGSGLRPDRLAPYLALLQLESILEDASLTGHAKIAIPTDPSRGWDLNLSNLTLADKHQLFLMKSIAISGLQVSPNADAVAIKSLQIVGPEIRGTILTDQRMELLGLRTILAGLVPNDRPAKAQSLLAPMPYQPSSRRAVATAPNVPDTAPSELVLPTVRLDHFSWKGVKLQLDDQSTASPTSLLLQEVELEVDNLLWDPSGQQVPQEGTFSAHLSAPSIANRLELLKGTFTPTRRGLSLNMTLEGTGLTGRELSQYLVPMGITPALSQGKLAGEVYAEIGLEHGQLTGLLKVKQFKFTDGNIELAAVDQLEVDQLRLSLAGQAYIHKVFVDHPRIALGRNPAGDLTVLGMVLSNTSNTSASATPVRSASSTTSTATSATTAVASATPASSAAAAPSVATESSTATTPSSATASTSASPAAASQPATTQATTLVTTQPTSQPAPLALDKLEIREAEIGWNDLAISPEYHTALRISIDLSKFSLAPDAPAADLSLSFSADGLVEPSYVTKGKVSVSSLAQKLSLDLATGLIDGRPLSRYLKPAGQVTLQQARFKAHLDLSAAVNPEGGNSLFLQVRDVDLSESGSAAPLLKLDDFTVRASRLDPTAGHFAFNEISMVGLGLDVFRDDQGLNALGICLQPQAESAPAQSPATQPAPAPVIAQTVPATVPAASATASVATPVESDEAILRRTMQQVQQSLPLVTIKYLWMEKGQIRYRDIRKSSPMAFTLSDLGLMNDNNKWIEIGGPRAAMLSPIEITLWADMAPVIKKIVVMTQASPLSFQPAGRIDLWVSGISGNGLTQAVPSLKKTIDGSTLTDGELEAHISAQARTLRRAGLPDFASPFDADFLARQIAYRAVPGGPTLAGIGEIRGEGAHIIPATGSVHLKTLEITSLTGRANIDPAGLHLLGLTIPLATPPAATQPSGDAVDASQPANDASATADALAAPAAPEPAKSQSAKTASASTDPLPAEMGIDKFTISGIDLLLEDTSVKPAFVMPINQLDVEVRGLSNHAMYKPNMPINFSAFMGAGKSSPESDREVFSQISTNGQIVLYPNPSGWAKSSVDAFDLKSLTGIAEKSGISLGRGYVDVSVDSRFQPNGDMNNRVKVIVSDLQLSEPENGPIQKSMGWMAPLNLVILGLEDPSGGITVPLDVPVEKGKIDPGSIISSAKRATGPIVATAIASVPFKILGIGGEKQLEANIAPAPISYPEGSTLLDAPGQEQLKVVIDRLKKDKRLQVTLTQQVSAADLALAMQRANPTPDQVRQIASQLRTQKFQLLTRRSDLQGEIRAQLAYQSDAVGPLLAELRQLNHDLASTESSLDRTYDLMRPGAGSQSLQRARKAALEVAQQRLEDVKAQLLASGVPEIDQRVKVFNLRFAPPKDQETPGQVIITFVNRGK